MRVAYGIRIPGPENTFRNRNSNSIQYSLDFEYFPYVIFFVQMVGSGLRREIEPEPLVLSMFVCLIVRSCSPTDNSNQTPAITARATFKIHQP